MSRLNSLVSMALTATATLLTPSATLAASFDYDQVTLFSSRPIDSNDVLSFFGDLSNNEGYTTVNNIDPTTFDSGHISTAQNAIPSYSAYYTMGREASPDLDTAGERSATLESIDGFPNFFRYLQNNNIPLSSIGFGYGQKAGREFTQTLNLGENRFRQDWLSNPNSPIEQRIYQANPDDYNVFLSLGTNQIVDLGYSPTYFAVDNGDSPDFTDNFNVFFDDPTPASKVEGLDSLESGLADAFLQDVSAAGGLVQFVSEDILKRDQVQVSFVDIGNETYDITYIGFPVTVSAVGETANVPESSSTLALLLLTGFGIFTQVRRQNNSN